MIYGRFTKAEYGYFHAINVKLEKSANQQYFCATYPIKYKQKIQQHDIDDFVEPSVTLKENKLFVRINLCEFREEEKKTIQTTAWATSTEF